MHTPTLLQMEAVECGAAALGILLAHYGRHVPMAELRRECGVSRDGSNALAVVRAARRYGLEARGLSLEVDELRLLPPPSIVYWGFNHFLVVEGFGRRRVLLNDPAVGHRRVGLEEFEEGFTGLVLDCVPGPAFRRGGRRPSLVAGLAARAGGLGSALGFAVLAGLLLVIPGLALAALTQVFIDEVLVRGREDWLRPLVLALFAVTGVQAALSVLQLRCLRRLRLGLAARLSSDFFRHLLRLPVDFYEQRFAGEIADRSGLNDKVAGVLSGQLARTTIELVAMLFYGALMWLYDPRLTLVGVGCAGLSFLALRRMARWRVEANMRLLSEYGKVSGISIAGLQGIETLKASGLEQGFFRRWAGHYASASNARQGFELTNEGLAAGPALLFSAAHAAVLVLGGLYVIEGHMTIGMLIAFRLLMTGFLRPVGGLVRLGQTMQELSGDLARLDDVLAHAPDPEEREPGERAAQDAVPRAPARLRGALELCGVTFGYNPTAPPLLEDLSLRLAPGRRLALVGPSGSGKSTIARLVCGLYRPWSGRVLLDGRPREELPPGALWASLALVDQEILLFEGSVRDNLTLWDPSVPDAALEAACRDAEIEGRVRSLGGLEGRLGERGANLSGGERQRLEIARALVGRPSLLVLDEATSALDAESERAVVERIAARGCACLVVAHRLSTVRDCDEILVLDQGRVVERGTHAELWERDGAYARLLRTDEGELLEAS